jgi:hypothetical protein
MIRIKSSVVLARTAAASAAVLLAACGDFLTGPQLGDDNPNQPTVASAAGLFTGAQANLILQAEADLARTVCVWMQQCSAQTTYLNYGTYAVIGDGDTWYQNWYQTYGGGGLIDLRRLQQVTVDNGDSAYAGVGKVVEAWLVGTAADVWGDIPYSQAADSTITSPALDPQQDVYAAVQQKLDTAITFLAASSARNVGPGAVDLFYGGDLELWTRLAHTLKARYHLHTAEVLGAAAYAAARDEALQGLQEGEDFRTPHSGADVRLSNIWFQFTSTQAQNYIAAGKFQVDLLDAAGDARLAEYYDPATGTGTFVGADPGEELLPSELSTIALARTAPDFPQPVVTSGENQLILAESEFALGNEPGARDALAAAITSATGIAPGALPSGQALLEAIMTEKYIELFQNIEVWSDYRRTCLPALVPFSGATAIPARLPYPLTERSANSSITSPGPARNWNDPNGC